MTALRYYTGIVKRHENALIFVILSPRKESRADFDVCGIYRLKIKPLIINALLVCLCLFWSLAGTNVPLAHATETDSEAEIAQPTLVLDHDLSLAKPITTQSKSTADSPTASPKKSATRVKLRMSRSIANFEALNNQQVTTKEIEIDIASLKKEADDESKILGEGGAILEGDQIEQFFDRNLTAFGNSILKTDSMFIKGDRIEFSNLDHTLTSSGKASVKNNDILVEGPLLHLNTDDSTGEMLTPKFTIYKGFVTAAPDRIYMAGALGQLSSISTYNTNASKVKKNADGDPEPNSRGSSEILYFEGETKRRLLNSMYTTCSIDSDDWYIKSKELIIDTESKVGVSKNATVEFKNIPILYTPYMSFPYDNQRKSGLINPTMGSTTSSGFELDLPVYWNIAPDMDATETNRYLSKRGIQLQGEFRYLLESGKSYGTDQIQFLPSDQMTHKDRYLISLLNKQNFGNGLNGGINFNKVSDDQYFSDLSTQILVTSQVNLQQQAYLNYAYHGWNTSTTIERFQNLDKASYAYERLPQISIGRTDQYDWGKTTFNNQFTEFKIDPLATNQAVKSASRFFSQGSVTYPLNTAYGFITPKIGYNYASYNLNEIDQTISNQQYGSILDKSSSRAVPIFSIDSGLFFDRDMKVVSNSYTQTLEPRLFYVYIPYVDQKKMPVFDSGLADLNMGTLFTENQYVGGDRINNANQLSAALSSRLIDSNGIQRLGVTIGERFYFTPQRVSLPGEALRSGDRSDIVGTASAMLKNNWSINSSLDYSTDSGNLMKANIGARYNPEPGKNLNLSYRYTKDTLEQVVGSTQWALGHGYYALANLNYSILDGKAVEMVTGIEYDAGCWQSRFVIQRVQTATAQANYAFFYQLVLGGMTSIGTSPIDLLHRTVPGYRNSSMLPENYRQEYNE